MSLEDTDDKHLDFWKALDALATSHDVVIERPRGSSHPRYSKIIYPLDYGYLEGTMSNDGACIDVWIGSSGQKTVDAAVLTVDLDKRDSEIKVLLGCTPEETQTIYSFHDKGTQSALLVQRSSSKIPKSTGRIPESSDMK